MCSPSANIQISYHKERVQPAYSAAALSLLTGRRPSSSRRYCPV
jgi:hypothetical protein